MGLGGGGKGAPAPPDFTRAATPNQSTPWASSTWNERPGGGAVESGWGNRSGQGAGNEWKDAAGMWHQGQAPSGGRMEQHVGLNPQLDQANQSMMGQLGSAWENPLDNGAQARQHAEDAIYGREASRLDPQWQQREQAFNTQLANQGIDPNSNAGQQAFGNFGRQRNDAYQQAQYGAITGGGQEAERQQGMDLRSRLAPLAGMSGLQGLSGMPQNPLLPAAMAQYQGQLQNYGIQQQGKNSMLGGLLGLGGTLGGAAMLRPSGPAAPAAPVGDSNG